MESELLRVAKSRPHGATVCRCHGIAEPTEGRPRLWARTDKLQLGSDVQWVPHQVAHTAPAPTAAVGPAHAASPAVADSSPTRAHHSLAAAAAAWPVR